MQKISWWLFYLHVDALPIQDKHTGEVMLLMNVLLLDVLCLDRKTKRLGVASDSARNITGRKDGVVTRLGNAFSEGCIIILIWLGAHQLDLVMLFVIYTVVKENFFSEMTEFISHLRWRQLVQVSMKSTFLCIFNHWLSTDKVTRWFKESVLSSSIILRTRSRHPRLWAPCGYTLWL